MSQHATADDYALLDAVVNLLKPKRYELVLTPSTPPRRIDLLERDSFMNNIKFCALRVSRRRAGQTFY